MGAYQGREPVDESGEGGAEVHWEEEGLEGLFLNQVAPTGTFSFVMGVFLGRIWDFDTLRWLLRLSLGAGELKKRGTWIIVEVAWLLWGMVCCTFIPAILHGFFCEVGAGGGGISGQALDGRGNEGVAG